jgi:hypothetical protein
MRVGELGIDLDRGVEIGPGLREVVGLKVEPAAIRECAHIRRLALERLGVGDDGIFELVLAHQLIRAGDVLRRPSRGSPLATEPHRAAPT